MFKKMPFLLLAFVTLIALFNQTIPVAMQSFLYALSLSIKSIILFILPFIIFGLLFNVAVQLANRATKLILFILAAVCCSNFVSTLLSRSIGGMIYQFDLGIMTPSIATKLIPAWTFQLPSVIGNDKSMFLALILGIAMGYFHPLLAKRLAQQCKTGIHYTLTVFTYIIPFFILGFIIQLGHDGAIAMIVKDYALIFLIILFAVFSYIALLYFIGSHFKVSTFIHRLKNMLPAGVAGFSTMSSAAAMPFTIMGTERNAHHPSLAQSVIPATVNIHLIGDCFAIPILAFALLNTFGLPEPCLSDYLIFSTYFVIAKFSVAAVPGGGIFVMLPILKNYLGFDDTMLSLITALYILFDPIITCANVMGNGAFALLIDRLSMQKSYAIKSDEP